jgi:predicted DNA-binding transcriptional regulator YafY
LPRADRLLHLVNLLSGRRARSLKEIVEHLEISPRTAYRDLADLNARRIPVTRDEAGYRLLETATLRPLNLTAQERAILRLALDNPAIARQPALARPLEVLRAKLDAATAAAEESPEALALAGPDRSGVVSQEVLDALLEAIAGRRAVELDYASLSGEQRTWRGLDPYHLFQRSDAWYLVGRCHRNDAPRTFRLDRIHGTRPLAHDYEVAEGFSLEDYLAHAWGVFRSEALYDVVLKFDPALAPLLENARHHEGEELTRLPSGELEYRVTLSHLEEIARWVLGFAGRCRVVTPIDLARRVREMAEGVLGAHSGQRGRSA